MNHSLVQRWLRTVHPSWMPTLDRVRDALDSAAQEVERVTASGGQVLPSEDRVFRALEQPLDQVRVLIIGQDPYPTPGNAVGMAFSVAADAHQLPASLRNIFVELGTDLEVTHSRSGDLSDWAQQGVMLLNRVLTVRSGEAGSMRGIGWELVTAEIVRTVVERGGPLVAVLWGADANTVRSELEGVAIVASAHPSPLSAHRGFFGAKPFSQVNELLEQQGAAPIDWIGNGAETPLW